MAAWIAQTSDMTMADLLCKDQPCHSNNSPRAVDRKESRKSPLIFNTKLHEICRKGSLEGLVRHLETPPTHEIQWTSDREKKLVYVAPIEEVMTLNPEGQLPLHLAVLNNRIIQEIDGIQSALEDVEQPAPVMLACCLRCREKEGVETEREIYTQAHVSLFLLLALTLKSSA